MEQTAVALTDVVRRACIEQNLFEKSQRVLLGVSGGADSVALLSVLSQIAPELQLKLGVVHVDHRLRRESSLDSEFVEGLAARYSLPFFRQSCDVPAYLERNGGSMEDAARQMRYSAFHDAAAKFSADAVALAHTADDQAETVMMRLLRGTGLTGLGAIPWKRLSEPENRWQSAVMIVRPLLGVWRRQIIRFLEETGQRFREDPSNRDLSFTRNRVRHELLPFIEDHYNPKIREALAQLAEQSRTETDLLTHLVRRNWKRIVKERAPHYLEIDVDLLRRQPKALQRQVLRRAVFTVRGNLKRFEYRHWLELEPLLSDKPIGTVVSLPGGVRFERLKQSLLCTLAEEQA